MVDNETSIEEQLWQGRERFLAFIRRKVASPELAEDILQDSLLRVIKSAPALRDNEKLVPWFYRILNNAIIDVYRRSAAHPENPFDQSLSDKLAAFDSEETALCECFRDVLPTLKPDYAELIAAQFLEIIYAGPN